MAFMMKKKRYKFSVECCVEELTEVPFVAAVVLFAKVRLLDGGNFQEQSSREEVKNHTVRWNATFQFVCKMSANASTGVLDTSVLRISVRKECKGGRSYQKLGFVDVNLASLAGAGEASRRCLLEGYDARRRQDNSTLRLKIRMNMLSGDPLFKVPSPSLNHKQLLGDGGSISELPEQTPPPAEPPPLPTPLTQQQSQLAQSLTQVDLGRDDCGSSIASGSSGFGSLPKKRPALFGSELLNHQSQTTIMSTEPQSHHQFDFNSSEQTSEESESGGTLQRQRSGSDMLDGCVMSHPATATHCPACLQGHTHSRNSSNTSGEMSSKASGYGSSLSQQSQHSRQSSEGGDSSEGGRHAPPTSAVHIRNPSGSCLVMSETGSLDRAKAALERRKHQKGGTGTLGPMTLSSASAETESQTGHAVSGRVENTRVNPDSLIAELLKATNLQQVEDSAETSGLQLFIAKDGTAALGSQQIKSQMSQGNRAFKQVVMDDR